jgi:indolepyruvate ferredoxin oxidoreductase alpha subunit
VDRVRRIVNRDTTPEPKPVPGKPPELCQGCPHRSVFAALRDLGCIVSGDIGCYGLGALPPFEAVDSILCMGASIGAGLGMRHVLPPDQARRVVSVIGDSTFLHSGLTGLVEMVYNPPPSGHLVIILDNGTTAMTGFQEHPGTGRALDHKRGGKVSIDEMIRAAGVADLHVIDPTLSQQAFQELVRRCLDQRQLSVIVARRECLLAVRSIREYERCNEQQGN